ncbi:hypothetical protein GQ43DRAFT_48746 [Delitschia confertaspora ATCC 74209]|uniref:Uncharacterized protein n=1 Tax=Delitschia confertaspora ATCC 74209 TaxID=1513339 RepID=A0A9P4MSI5_9PLEO|nr:hypothetical protein GQ43DRAFT_48746 [Delitschia confertaspora ATCC 74209]
MASTQYILAFSRHAHPKSGLRYPWKAPEKPATLKLRIELTGLIEGDHQSIADVYYPTARRSSTYNECPVHHLDVVSCWKGLSTQQASEILFWETLFKESLEELVLRDLLKASGESPSCSEVIDINGPFMSHLPDLCRGTQHIKINEYNLMSLMAKRYSVDERNKKYKWFNSSGDIKTAMHNFLQTRDCFRCFRDSSVSPELDVQFKSIPEAKSKSLVIIGSVQWHPPRVILCDLPSRLSRGSEYRIVPHYTSFIFNETYPSFPIDTVYYVSSYCLPLAWDQNVQGFRAIIPDGRADDRRTLLVGLVDGADEKVTVMETTLTAAITRMFPGNVRFEQTTRYLIRLKVSPANNVQTSPKKEPLINRTAPSCTSTPLLKSARVSGPRKTSMNSSVADCMSPAAAASKFLDDLSEGMWKPQPNFASKAASQVDIPSQNALLVVSKDKEGLSHDLTPPVVEANKQGQTAAEQNLVLRPDQGLDLHRDSYALYCEKLAKPKQVEALNLGLSFMNVPIRTKAEKVVQEVAKKQGADTNKTKAWMGHEFHCSSATSSSPASSTSSQENDEHRYCSPRLTRRGTCFDGEETSPGKRIDSGVGSPEPEATIAELDDWNEDVQPVLWPYHRSGRMRGGGVKFLAPSTATGPSHKRTRDSSLETDDSECHCAQDHLDSLVPSAYPSSYNFRDTTPVMESGGGAVFKKLKLDPMDDGYDRLPSEQPKEPEVQGGFPSPSLTPPSPNGSTHCHPRAGSEPPNIKYAEFSSPLDDEKPSASPSNGKAPVLIPSVSQEEIKRNYESFLKAKLETPTRSISFQQRQKAEQEAFESAFLDESDGPDPEWETLYEDENGIEIVDTVDSEHGVSEHGISEHGISEHVGAENGQEKEKENDGQLDLGEVEDYGSSPPTPDTVEIELAELRIGLDA